MSIEHKGSDKELIEASGVLTCALDWNIYLHSLLESKSKTKKPETLYLKNYFEG